jgi:hypothetical protein
MIALTSAMTASALPLLSMRRPAVAISCTGVDATWSDGTCSSNIRIQQQQQQKEQQNEKEDSRS